MSSKGLIKRFSTYLDERFNPFQMLFLSFSFSLLLMRLFSFYGWFLISVSMFLLLLQLRLTDEFKDFDHDKIYYPGRPVPRGLIDLPEIGKIRGSVITCELLIFLAGSFSAAGLILLQVYFYLMAKEFFIKKWLRKHFTFYIISHEISAVFLFLYLSSYGGGVGNFYPVEFLKTAVFLTLCLFILEIARKIRNSSSYVARDTYAEVYGLTATKIILFLFFILAVFLSGVFPLSPALFTFITVCSALGLLSQNYKVNRYSIMMSVFIIIISAAHFKYF